ncbi:MAG TPA: TrkA family potassium uptake protein, partial [Roseiflexaceae bacterium]|nr:TrkA family potassium uptake protein [Roseiflexaceae bacterium]
MTYRKHHAEFAVIGLGRFGSSLALTLVERGFHVLGIDRDQPIVQRLADKITQVVQLDSTDEEALTAVDITSFDTVVVAIGSNFEANLLTTVALKALKVERVICKALNERQRTILLRVGADRVILPEFEAGARLAQELAAPGMVDQIALGSEHSIIELRVPRSLVGQSIMEADLRRRFGITILAIKRNDILTVSPPPDYTLTNGDILAVIGENTCIARIS